MKARWHGMVEAAQDEALLAIELFNQPQARTRRLEAFYVHMHIAWMYLLHAEFHKRGVDCRYRQASGRFVRVDGDPKAWDLSKCIVVRYPIDSDPVRLNLEFTVQLRNKVEHRFEEATALATQGHAQALVVNFEEELAAFFGDRFSLADQLRFPVFVGSITGASRPRIKKLRETLPARTRDFIARFEAGLSREVAEDQRFEFRLLLMPKLGPRTEADQALRFVRDDELTDEERIVLEKLGSTGAVVVRERLRPVANLGLMKPTPAARAIEEQIPFRFRASSEFPAAWRALDCRPRSGSANPRRTIDRYCVYDEPHRDYLYTQAFTERVVRETSTAEQFQTFLGRSPTLKAQDMAEAS